MTDSTAAAAKRLLEEPEGALAVVSQLAPSSGGSFLIAATVFWQRLPVLWGRYSRLCLLSPHPHGPPTQKQTEPAVVSVRRATSQSGWVRKIWPRRSLASSRRLVTGIVLGRGKL